MGGWMVQNWLRVGLTSKERDKHTNRWIDSSLYQDVLITCFSFKFTRVFIELRRWNIKSWMTWVSSKFKYLEGHVFGNEKKAVFNNFDSSQPMLLLFGLVILLTLPLNWTYHSSANLTIKTKLGFQWLFSFAMIVMRMLLSKRIKAVCHDVAYKKL